MGSRTQLNTNANASSASLAANGILQRQCTSCGNQTVAGGECTECGKKKTGLQRKLMIGASNDPLELEADRVADQVMAASINPAISNAPLRIQRFAGQITEGVDTAPASVDRVLAGSGRPLEPTLRHDMEARFGHDFSQVRVHYGGVAAQSAMDVNANAYTVGNDIVFSAGMFAPATHKGRRLLAHELTHTIQQSYGSILYRQQAAPQITCSRTFTRAGNFSELIALVREAETRLQAAGYSSVEDRLHVLRGIYYGTTWSADYFVEHSEVRNLGFQTYTASTTPDDPRPQLPCNLFEALRSSRDVTDGSRQIDFGHLIIGMDARRSFTARNVSIPTQGGTGLEISTWLGDLGGGAGMLAVNRVSTPTTRASTKFRGSDFGGSPNIEGDVAGYLVASNASGTSGSLGLVMSPGQTIADNLAMYLSPSGAGAAWNSRCTNFMQRIGGIIDSNNNVSNRAALITTLSGKIEEFACWYLVNRLRQAHRLTLPTLRNASNHVSGASVEIASIFVDALDYCNHHSGVRLQARSDPSPTPVGTTSPTPCNIAISSLETVQQAEEFYQQGREMIRDYWPF